MPTTYLTPGEVAKQLRISRTMVIKYMDAGRIKFATIAGRRVIRAGDVKKPVARTPGPKPA